MSSLFSSNMQYQSMYDETSFFKPTTAEIGIERKLAMDTSSKRKFVKTSLKITDFSLIKELQDAIPSPNQDALVPQLEEIPLSLVELKGSITATIEDLERMHRAGPDGPLSLLGSVPSIRAVQIENDFEPSSELHHLDEAEQSMNIGEFLRKDTFLKAPPRPESIPISIMEASSISPASVYSGTSSPAHFFESPTDSLPASLDFTNQTTFGGFSCVSPKKEDTFPYSSPSTSMFGLFGESSDPSDSRYNEMRRKNNIASKRSRQTRREKEIENENKAKKLQDENAHLKRKVQQLEQQTEKLKKYLICSVMRRN